jgi:hypothetical protein
MPGIVARRWLASFDLCHANTCRSSSRIWSPAAAGAGFGVRLNDDLLARLMKLDRVLHHAAY